VLAEVKQAAMTRLAVPVPPGPQLHLLAIGISNYNPQRAGSLHLDYAKRDARDFANKIMATQGTLYTVKPNFLPDSAATRDGIMQAFQNIHSGMEKGSGNDLAVVFFAGHGAIVDGELFLLSYNVDPRSPAGVKASALSVYELKRELVGLAARGRVLVLLDACHSGASTGVGVSLGTDAAALRADLLAPNITVLTSSTGREISREDSAWGHGAFTKVLLDAIADPAADINHDRLINLDGLANYVSTRVRALTRNAQNPAIAVHFSGSGSLFASTHP
jgi:uncharacterized caspase-like protein